MVLAVVVVGVVLAVVVAGAGHNILVAPAWKKCKNFNFPPVNKTQNLTLI